MAKRRITHQQAKRIADTQERRRARADAALEKLGSGPLGPEKTGRLIAHFGASVLIESEDKQEYHCAIRQNLPALIVGDEVIWQSSGPGTQGVVCAMQPRRSCLYRGTPDHLVAANVDQLLVVVAPSPAPTPTTLDRYLVAAAYFGVEAVIIQNKSDLDSDELMNALSLYQNLGYPCVVTNAKEADGILPLQPYLAQKTSILVGQSGVGKSSLVNLLMHGVHEKTGGLTARGHGRHTTSVSRLHHLAMGGDLIDSPGVRQFQLTDLGAGPIAQGFIEFRPFLGHCQFRDCKHKTEPRCALRTAVENGDIQAIRLQHYHSLVEEIERC